MRMMEHKPISDEELQKIFERCERATPGCGSETVERDH
jgi:hypothetical protein